MTPRLNSLQKLLNHLKTVTTFDKLLRLFIFCRVGPAPPMPKTDAKIPLQTVIDNNLYLKPKHDITIRTPKGVYVLTPRPELLVTPEKTVPGKTN